MGIRSAIRTLLLATTVTAGLLGGLAPAQAAPATETAAGTAAEVAAAKGGGTIEATETYRNLATGRCLEDVSVLRTFNCRYDLPQQWIVKVWADGTRELKNAHTGRCIDDSFAYGLRALYPCWGNTYQSWYVKRYADGSIRFQNQATGRCIDDSVHGLRPWDCHDDVFQRWV